jgi:EmrB/QacA subfamily drug resistance transporter
MTPETTHPDVRTDIDPEIHRRRWAILAVLCMSLFLAVVDNTIVNVALPTISTELGASTSALQWIVDSYSLVFAGLLLVGGSLGDRFGRKRALQLGLVLFAAFSVYAGMADGTGELIAGRALMGIGAALIFPATLAILTNVFTDGRERAKAIGIWSGVVGLAVALGPITGGFLLQHFWWGSIFFVNVPVVAVALVLGARMLPDSRDEHSPALDYGGFVLSAAGITAVVFTMIEAPHWGWGNLRTIGGFLLGAALVGAFVQWERRRREPMMDVTVFTNRRFSAASAAVTVAFFSLFGFIFLITQYFQFVKGYSTLSAGVHTLPFAIATGSLAPVSPLIARRIGRRATVALGLLVMAAGFVVASTVAVDSAYFGRIIVSMVMIAGGLALVSAPATDVIVSALPPEKAGVGSAINDVTRELGGVLGVAVVGSVFSSVFGPRLAERFTEAGVPDAAVTIAEESMGASLAVAGQAPVQAQAGLVGAARESFVDALGNGVLVAAAASLFGAAAVWWAMRDRTAERADTDADVPDLAVAYGD